MREACWAVCHVAKQEPTGTCSCKVALLSPASPLAPSPERGLQLGGSPNLGRQIAPAPGSDRVRQAVG